MFIAISRFRVANGKADEVRDAFLNRPHRVDRAAGFLQMEVLRPLDDPDEFWLVTHWRDAESFHAWRADHEHGFGESHAGIPAGLRLDPSATRIRYFEHLCA